MKATKFWMTAAATVATAGMIGVAIAQTSQQPVPEANDRPVSERGSLPASGNSGSMNPGSTTGSSSSMNSGPASSDSSSTSLSARADRG